MLLISASPSPFARKVRIALMEKGVEFELRNEIPWHADTETPLYNPLEQLPILIPDNDEEPLYGSDFILDWIEVEYPEPRLLPADKRERLAVQRIQVLAEGVMDALVLSFFECQRDHPSPDWMARQFRKILGGLGALELRAGEGLFVADQFTLADVAVVSLLGMMDIAEQQEMQVAWRDLDPTIFPWRARFPALARFEGRLRDRPSVAATGPFMFDLRQKVM
ncbi:glutathione S-transferase N-terminal domain-containing protein [Aquisediminimonas sediminicola]|uniref:glutathione S-transferase N-terminal domain-containing protein n=1 Tax=Alteraquisediminimonas sediminicola TaxID=2676787 RepID=UPI001C8DDD58|nr:glutathione S-transferase N-terminal domain-containing protein [Aquisediminimonas sediminicola]